MNALDAQMRAELLESIKRAEAVWHWQPTW